VSSALDDLRASFRDRLAERVGEIEAAWEAVARGGDASPEALSQLLRLAHSLYGTAGTFGYPEAGLASRALEHGVREILDRPGPPRAADLAALGPLVSALRSSL